MTDYHGIIFAYAAAPEMRELVSRRTSASLPVCGRYRIIDFTLSSFANAGIHDVGVIMQRDYQSLLDHLGSGKAWDMSRRTGGLRMLPPFGLPGFHSGNYSGTMEALNAVSSYIKDTPQNHVILLSGNVIANIDLEAAIASHEKSGLPLTAICAEGSPCGRQHRYIINPDGTSDKVLFYCTEDTEGVASLGGYIIDKPLLLELMDYCRARYLCHFHVDALQHYLAEGGKINIYMHTGYAAPVITVNEYFRANMDMLDSAKRRDLFTPQRPIFTKNHEEVSTYYGENAVSVNSLVADNCIIEGTVENCIVFSGVRIAAGARLRNCIVMRGCTVGPWTELTNVIADKNCSFGSSVTLTGSDKLPVVVPKDSIL